jgi:rhodanese-related sulfurtransferase
MSSGTRWTVRSAGLRRTPVAMWLCGQGGSERSVFNGGIGAWENEGGKLAHSAWIPGALPVAGRTSG